MPRPEAREDDKVVETWESCIPGTVWVWVYDRREDRYIMQSIGGSTGSRRLHITRDDRKYNQEQVPIENHKLDPFTNGSLRLVEAATRDDSLDQRYHLSNTDLAEMFEVRDINLFTEAITDIDSELVLRRLSDMSEEIGTVAQNEALKELIRLRYPIGGTQKAVQEMIDAGERLAQQRF